MKEEQISPQQNDNPCIFVIDDELNNILLLVKLLKEKGYRVRAARDGGFALQSLEKETVDLILLDIMMPDMSGFEVCEKLKENRRTASIPIIFLSAMDETENKIKGLEMGAVDYITKPFDLDEVLARVSRQLKLFTEFKKVRRSGKYRRTSLDVGKRREICRRLTTFFEEEKPYLSDTLNAGMIAKKLNVTTHNLGEAVNLELQENISSLINRYRIEYFCELQKQQPKATVFDLALLSGFNSKSVFHKWFKTIKKTTPKKYSRSHRG